MIPVARLGDRTIGYCKCHKKIFKGTIVSASSDHKVNNLGVARLGDMILSDCGHTAKIITASSLTITNNLGTARLGDKGEGACYTCKIITASPDTFTN